MREAADEPGAAAVERKRQWDRLMAMATARRHPGRRRQPRLPDRPRPPGAPAADRLGGGNRRHRLGGRRGEPVAAARGQRSAGRSRGHRQPHGHPAERRPVRRHLRRDRRTRGADRAARCRARCCAVRSRWSPGPTRKAAGSRPAAWAAWRGAAFRAHRGLRRRRPTPTASASPTRWPTHLQAGGRPAAPSVGRQPHAYVEAHIEQGPRLEAEGLDIGVVTGIQGSRWFTVTLHRRDRACRHHAARAAARRGAGHGARDHRAERTDARSARRAALHRRPRSWWSRTRRIRWRTGPASRIDFRHPDKDVLLARGDAVAGVVQAAVRDAGVTVQETFPCAAGRVLAAGDRRRGARRGRSAAAPICGCRPGRSMTRSSSCRCARPG